MLSRIQWAEAERSYIREGMTQRAIAAKYGITQKSVSLYAVRHEWEYKRQQFIAGGMVLPEPKEIPLPKAHLGLTDEEARANIYRAADVAAERIAEHLTNDTIGAAALKSLTSALRDIKEIRDCRDGLSIREMEARIAKLRKDTESNTADTEININISGDSGLSG